MWILVLLGLSFGSYELHKHYQRQEYERCEEWAKTQNGFWLRDPCEDLNPD